MNPVIHCMSILEIERVPPAPGWRRYREYMIFVIRALFNTVTGIGRMIFQRSEMDEHMERARAKCRYYGTF